MLYQILSAKFQPLCSLCRFSAEAQNKSEKPNWLPLEDSRSFHRGLSFSSLPYFIGISSATKKKSKKAEKKFPGASFCLGLWDNRTRRLTLASSWGTANLVRGFAFRCSMWREVVMLAVVPCLSFHACCWLIFSDGLFLVEPGGWNRYVIRTK